MNWLYVFTNNEYDGVWECYSDEIKLGTCKDNEIWYNGSAWTADTTGWVKQMCKKVGQSTSGGGGGSSDWDETCDSNNKFKKGCKSEKIKELQKALGLLGNDVDGKWGNDTQTAMELKFPSLANGVTSSEIDKIKDGAIKSAVDNTGEAEIEPSTSSVDFNQTNEPQKEKIKRSKKYIGRPEDTIPVKEQQERTYDDQKTSLNYAISQNCIPKWLIDGDDGGPEYVEIELDGDIVDVETNKVIYTEGQTIFGLEYVVYPNDTFIVTDKPGLWIINQEKGQCVRWYCQGLRSYKQTSGDWNQIFDKFGIQKGLDSEGLVESLNGVTDGINKLINKGAVSNDFVTWSKVIKKFKIRYTSLKDVNPDNKSISLPDKTTLDSYYENQSDNIPSYFPNWKSVTVYIPVGSSLSPESAANRGETPQSCKSYLTRYLRDAIYSAADVSQSTSTDITTLREYVRRCGKQGFYDKLQLTKYDVFGNNSAPNVSPFSSRYGSSLDWSEIKKFLKGEFSEKNYDGEAIKQPNPYVYNMESTIKNKIKANLTEIVLDRRKRIIQERVIKERTNILFENVNFRTRKERQNFVIKLINESLQLENQGLDKKLIKENFWNVVKAFFGKDGSESIFMMFKTKMGKWLTSHMSPKKSNGWIGNCIRKTIQDISIDNVDKITNCKFLTREITKSLIEKLNEKMSDENLKDEGLYDVVRNGITDNVNSSLFKEHIEDKISSMICPIVSDLSSNLDTNFEMMKKRILDF
jgi:hypothetical protein